MTEAHAYAWRRNRLQHLARFVVWAHRLASGSTPLPREASDSSPKLIPQKNGLQRQRSLGALVAGDIAFNAATISVAAPCWFCRSASSSRPHSATVNLALRPLRPKFTEQPVLQGNFLDLINDRFALF